MARPDGRIEKGQRIRSAISARAWNRAQDAADVVLGVRPGMTAGPGMVEHLRFVTVRVKKKTIDDMDWPEGVSLSIGHAIGLPSIGSRTTIKNPTIESFNPFQEVPNKITDESLLSVPTSVVPWLDIADMGIGNEQFGVITKIGEEFVDPETNLPAEADRNYFLTLAIGGVFMCRAIALGPGDRLIGPPPIPSNGNLSPMWRPYPLMAPAGPCRVLGVGAWYQLGQYPWPRVYECLVSM